jgi:hypothetical protein
MARGIIEEKVQWRKTGWFTAVRMSKYQAEFSVSSNAGVPSNGNYTGYWCTYKNIKYYYHESFELSASLHSVSTQYILIPSSHLLICISLQFYGY